MIFKKKLYTIISYLVISCSLLLIFYSFNNDILNFITDKTIKTDSGLAPLYAKTEYGKKERLASKISIKNGCGKKHLGLIYKRYLLELGYDITETTNAMHPNGQFHFGHSSTKILYHKKNKDSAIYLSNELGINKNQIFEDHKESSFHDLTLILGQNYMHLKSYKTASKHNPFTYESN